MKRDVLDVALVAIAVAALLNVAVLTVAVAHHVWVHW